MLECDNGRCVLHSERSQSQLLCVLLFPPAACAGFQQLPAAMERTIIRCMFGSFISVGGNVIFLALRYSESKEL